MPEGTLVVEGELQIAAGKEASMATLQPFEGAICGRHRSNQQHRCSGWSAPADARKADGVKVAGTSIDVDLSDVLREHEHDGKSCGVNHDGDENEDEPVRCGAFNSLPGGQGSAWRCTVCSSWRQVDKARPSGRGACSFLECKDPMYDVRAEDARASGESVGPDQSQPGTVLVGSETVDKPDYGSRAGSLLEAAMTQAEAELKALDAARLKHGVLAESEVRGILVLLEVADRARLLRDAFVATGG